MLLFSMKNCKKFFLKKKKTINCFCPPKSYLRPKRLRCHNQGEKRTNCKNHVSKHIGDLSKQSENSSNQNSRQGRPLARYADDLEE